MAAFSWPQAPLSSPVGLRAQRQAILEQIFSANSGHPGGSLSLVEILSSIFDGNFVHDSKKQETPTRDRIVLSKGHGVPALYSVLSYLNYFPPSELKNLRKLGSFLQGHPDRLQYPLMEASTGSLGQGASVALGLALGLKLDYQNKKLDRLPTVYCVMGDGELQEGQVWECLMATGKFRPSNLVFVLDYNKGQIDGPVSEIMDLEPLADKIKAFGLEVHEVDGHSVDALKKVFAARHADVAQGKIFKPAFVIAHTLKGKGISFMEHPTKWHGAAPSADQLKDALKELHGAESMPFGSILEAGV